MRKHCGLQAWLVICHSCKGNLTIRTKGSNTCKGKPKILIRELKQEINSYLARENQREYSKVPFARPGTMYRKGCDYLQ